MSKPYQSRSNRTPWTDNLQLINKIITKDSDGYETYVQNATTVYGSFTEGVNRSEYYEGLKAGLKLSAIVEVWQSEYTGQQWCQHNSVLYKIIRAYETGRGTVELTLSEEVR